MKPEVAIVGAGYVGMPLAQAFAEAGKPVVLVDIDGEVVAGINRGHSHIGDVSSDTVKQLVERGLLTATTDYDALKEADAILIALPTPLSDQREPDLTIVRAASGEIARRLRSGQLVVLESTTYPGTTRECVQPILEESGLRAGADFHLAFSPERVDPGRTDWTTRNTPKLVGGLTPECTERATALYRSTVDTVVPLSSPEAAEMTKLLENIFRAVNIALVNELAQLCERMDIDVWEVIDAASTKPFGFMRFTPGPGVGGHCLPVDPTYLSWQVRQRLGSSFRFVELANDVNDHMPDYVVRRIVVHLNRRELPVKGRRILVLGVAYKRNTGDARESPSQRICAGLVALGADVRVADPHVDERHVPPGTTLVVPTPQEVAAADLVVVLVDHDRFGLPDLVDGAAHVLDTRRCLPAGDRVEHL